ncbi:MAG TPA: ABC transporter ATP-binding protein, partial [Candidatus Binatus sp.]|nr:ABC transporter ATP-binding protein [Candidatus Binatus sp.]
IRASSGQALINGVDVHREKKKALDPCGVLIETPEIYPALTPREALSMIAELKGIPRQERAKRIDAVVAEVKMEEWMDKKVGKFSKGMKQRINVASALLADPEIVLLDEPTTGLDPRGQSEVRDIVKGLKQKNRLIFMSSHLLNEVSEICDEVAMIDHGKLLVYDTISNVTERFSQDGGETEIHVDLLKDIDEKTLNGQVSPIAGVVSAKMVNPRSVLIRINGGQEEQSKLLSELVMLNIGVVSFRPSTSRLEDTYLKMIKDTL